MPNMVLNRRFITLYDIISCVRYNNMHGIPIKSLTNIYLIDTVVPGIVDKLGDCQLVGQATVSQLELVAVGYCH